jgi:hypothetical protein
MKNLQKILVVLISLFFSFSCSAPSNNKGMPLQNSMFDRDNFYIDPLVFYDVDSTKARIDMYIKIPVKNILFKKDGKNNKYESKLLVSVILKNSNNEQIFDYNYNVSSSFGEDEMKKLSKESLYYFYNYYLEQGKYKLEVKINDENSRATYTRLSDLSVRDFKSQSIDFSDVMLLSNYRVNEDSTKEITPLISNNIAGLKEFFIFYEVYNNSDSTILKDFTCKIKEKDKTIKENSFTYSLSPNKNQITEKISLKEIAEKFKMPERNQEDFPPRNNMQNQNQGDFLQERNKDFDDFNLEIWDKMENKKIATKKLSVILDSHKQIMQNKPPMR